MSSVAVDSFSVSKRTAEKIAGSVRRCIAACADAEKGFALAASCVTSPALRKIFEGASAERGSFVLRLREVIAAIGEDVDDGGSALGALHRAAVDVRVAFAGATDRVILEECDRGERTAQHVYEVARGELLHMGAPKPIRDAVDAQYAALCDARHQIDQRLRATSPPRSGRSPR